MNTLYVLTVGNKINVYKSLTEIPSSIMHSLIEKIFCPIDFYRGELYKRDIVQYWPSGDCKTALDDLLKSVCINFVVPYNLPS